MPHRTTALLAALMIAMPLAACVVPPPAGTSAPGTAPPPPAAAAPVATAMPGASPTAGASATPAPAASPAVAPTFVPDTGASDDPEGGEAGRVGPGRGFPEAGPWLSFYADADSMGDLAAVAERFRIIDLDADPGEGNFTKAQIQTLKAGGRNRVLSYLNLGSVEDFREYWDEAPAGLTPARDLAAADLGGYDGYDDERWMDPADPRWRRLVLEHVVPRLVAQGVDGFYLDNLELLSHGASNPNGPCDADCQAGGRSLVRAIREKYPDMLLVLQNGTGAATRLGMAGDVAFASLLDGIAHESVFTTPDGAEDAEDEVNRVAQDSDALAELRAWKALGLSPGGRPLWIGVLEYVNACDNAEMAERVYGLARVEGFSPYASDTSAGQAEVCAWDF